MSPANKENMKGIVVQVRELLELGLNEINTALDREGRTIEPSLAEWYDVNVDRLRVLYPCGVEYLGLIADRHWRELMHRVEMDDQVDIWMIKAQ
jgi:hypothetical protein